MILLCEAQQLRIDTYAERGRCERKYMYASANRHSFIRVTSEQMCRPMTSWSQRLTVRKKSVRWSGQILWDICRQIIWRAWQEDFRSVKPVLMAIIRWRFLIIQRQSLWISWNVDTFHEKMIRMSADMESISVNGKTNSKQIYIIYTKYIKEITSKVYIFTWKESEKEKDKMKKILTKRQMWNIMWASEQQYWSGNTDEETSLLVHCFENDVQETEIKKCVRISRKGDHDDTE